MAAVSHAVVVSLKPILSCKLIETYFSSLASAKQGELARSPHVGASTARPCCQSTIRSLELSNADADASFLNLFLAVKLKRK